jgi:enoyl-CoA hydratase
VPHHELLPFAREVASRVPANSAVGEILDLYSRGQDTSLAGALAAETASSVGRTYDLQAFTAAGSATSARQREHSSTDPGRSRP